MIHLWATHYLSSEGFRGLLQRQRWDDDLIPSIMEVSADCLELLVYSSSIEEFREWAKAAASHCHLVTDTKPTEGNDRDFPAAIAHEFSPQSFVNRAVLVFVHSPCSDAKAFYHDLIRQYHLETSFWEAYEASWREGLGE